MMRRMGSRFWGAILPGFGQATETSGGPLVGALMLDSITSKAKSRSCVYSPPKDQWSTLLKSLDSPSF